ncbi:hypothetical protein E2P84_21445 [Burkholderia cepacia]|nr:hypothetical protein E2P84_21445 [Burkholderia cepacia]TES99356.1 hypothetical protein E3D36_25175 [Burkholderia cepacia]TEU37518.1 hypothetical protein E3D39_24515 [Burkholderia cepacia]TEU47158.1 hypothetical protein E3D38_24175 [Burkholderia cepacia]TEU66587.1 hypothetical protein E3D42_30040 [Burkholderia cepacia]
MRDTPGIPLIFNGSDSEKRCRLPILELTGPLAIGSRPTPETPGMEPEQTLKCRLRPRSHRDEAGVSAEVPTPPEIPQGWGRSKR